jgi:hypothetical protein
MRLGEESKRVTLISYWGITGIHVVLDGTSQEVGRDTLLGVKGVSIPDQSLKILNEFAESYARRLLENGVKERKIQRI